MKKPIEELDLDFDNTMSGLYVVYDITSNMDVSDVIMARNDAMAIEAFKKFVSDVKDKNKYSKFAIRNVGTYSHMSHRIIDSGEYDIINDNEDIEEYSQQIYEYINKEE